MDDLISRKTVLAAYDAAHKGPPGMGRKLIEEATAIDAVPVVRCRDCESWWPDTNEENCSSGFCRNQFGVCGGQTTDMDWFCADGERGE